MTSHPTYPPTLYSFITFQAISHQFNISLNISPNLSPILLLCLMPKVSLTQHHQTSFQPTTCSIFHKSPTQHLTNLWANLPPNLSLSLSTKFSNNLSTNHSFIQPSNLLPIWSPNYHPTSYSTSLKNSFNLSPNFTIDIKRIHLTSSDSNPHHLTASYLIWPHLISSGPIWLHLTSLL